MDLRFTCTLIAFATLLSTATVRAQQTSSTLPAAEAITAVQDRTDPRQLLVEEDLKLLSAIFGEKLHTFQADTIWEQLEPTLTNVSDKEDATAGAVRLALCRLVIDQTDGIAELIEQERKSRLLPTQDDAKLLADYVLKKKFQRDSYVLAATAVLDEMVSLKTQQREQMRDVFSNHWSPIAQHAFEFFVDASLERPIEGAANRIRQILTPAQLTQWKHGSLHSLAATDVPKAVETAVDLQIIWLTAELKLTAAQVQRLTLIRKGSIGPALRLYKGANAAAKTDVRIAGNRVVTTRTWGPETHEITMCTPSGLVLSHSRWNSLVRKILNDRQKASFDKLLQQRAARVHTACLSAFCQAISEIHPMSGAKLVALRQALLESTPVDPTGKRIHAATFHRLADMPQAKLATAVGKDDATALKTFFQHFTSQLGRVESRSTRLK